MADTHIIMTPMLDPQFMLWGTAYVVLKWTVGLWAFRRVKAGIRSYSR